MEVAGVHHRSARWKRQQAFTLIELIAVMALLAGFAAMTLPRFSDFFRGQKIKGEANRFIALTQYARSEAIATGIPMTLWIDEKQGQYGMRDTYGYYSQQNNVTNIGRIYELAQGLEFSSEMTHSNPNMESVILFHPDGAIQDGSISNIILELPDRELLWITRTTNGLGYEIFGTEQIR